MLIEEQAAELLSRCEKSLGLELSQIRGNLRNAETRAPAVWELLTIESAVGIGSVEYEPFQGSPDIRLHLPISESRPIWIEVAYLFPRFWREERQTAAIAHWLFQEAKRRGIEPWKIQPRFDGERTSKAGRVRGLPKLHEQKKFIVNCEIVDFFNLIIEQPEEQHYHKMSHYTIQLSYLPKATGPYLSYRGVAQEAPQTVKEHAVYRTLREKARQHNVSGPRVVCIGSDQSPVIAGLREPGQPSISEAIRTAFYEYTALSAVIIVSV